MKRTAHLLSAVAMAFGVAGCGSTEGGVDGGPPGDAGFHYTALSTGTATFAGGLTGTVAATAFAFSNPMGGLVLPDGGISGPYVYVQISSALSEDATAPNFGCSFHLDDTTTLDAGTYTPANVDQLGCFVVVPLPDGGTGDQWWGGYGAPFGPSNIFELQLASPGPATVFSSGTQWFDPSATLSVYLASSGRFVTPPP